MLVFWLYSLVCFYWLVKTHLSANFAITPGCSFYFISILFFLHILSSPFWHCFCSRFLFDNSHSELFLRQMFKNHDCCLSPSGACAYSPWGVAFAVRLCSFLVCSFLFMSHEYSLLNFFCHLTKFRLCFQVTVTY